MEPCNRPSALPTLRCLSAANSPCSGGPPVDCAEFEATIKAAAAGEGKPVSAWLAEAATEKARVAALQAAGRAAARELIAE
jgi:hypothetical protein